MAIKQAKALGLTNFSVFCNHVLTPSAIAAILGVTNEETGAPIQVDAFIGPGHVSIITGTDPYEPFAKDHNKPIVVSGFEPLDILRSVEMLIAQLNAGRAVVENQYTRAVTGAGNAKAQAAMNETLKIRDSFEWRGLGMIANSALAVADAFSEFDAERRYGIADRSIPDHPACECAAVLRGEKRPKDCRIFGTACTPDMPIGSCMVSPEGACAAHYLYGRFRDETARTADVANA
jgi:hydrogenase expression/formation protein HypD